MDSKEGFIKRSALQIAAQLPEDPKDAKKVIDLVLEILSNFSRRPRATQPSGAGKDPAKAKAGGQVTPLFVPDRANRGSHRS